MMKAPLLLVVTAMLTLLSFNTLPAFAQAPIDDRTTETLTDLQEGAKEGIDFIKWVEGFIDGSVHRWSPVTVPEWIMTLAWFIGLGLGVMIMMKFGKHILAMIIGIILFVTLLSIFAPAAYEADPFENLPSQ